MPILHFSKLVANSFEFVQSHLYIFIRSAYAPVIFFFFSLNILHFSVTQIVQIHMKSPLHKNTVVGAFAFHHTMISSLTMQ